MNKPHIHAKEIHAWADGKDIQAFGYGEWVDTGSPSWLADTKYRVKPETVKVWDWFVQYKFNEIVRVHGASEQEVREKFYWSTLFQRIDGTEREVEV